MSVQAATSPTEIDSRTRGLLEAPLLRTLMKLAAPNAAVMVTQISIPLVEIYFIAKISIDALAGVSEVFPVLSLVGAISQGAVGGGVVSAIARTLGSGQRSAANNLVWYTVGRRLPGLGHDRDRSQSRIRLLRGDGRARPVAVFGADLFQLDFRGRRPDLAL
jgi:hypothetical protein